MCKTPALPPWRRAGVFAVSYTHLVDIPIFLDVYGEWEGYYMLFEQLLLQQGVALGEIISGFLLTVAQLFLQILSYVGVAYLSITLSATILQSRKRCV